MSELSYCTACGRRDERDPAPVGGGEGAGVSFREHAIGAATREPALKDEIAGLRAEVEQQTIAATSEAKFRQEMDEENKTLRAEVERLTEALEEIRAVGQENVDPLTGFNRCVVQADRALRPTHNTAAKSRKGEK